MLRPDNELGLIRRPWGVFHLKNKITGEQTSLKPRHAAEALGMEWLLKSVIPRLQWPKPVYGEERAITFAEHAAIVEREANPERRDFYELLWHR